MYQGHVALAESVSISVIGGTRLLYHTFYPFAKICTDSLIVAGAKAFIPNMLLFIF